MRSFALSLATAFALVAFPGCSKSPGDSVVPPPAGQLPDSVPQANTPANLLERLESAWEHESKTEIEGMLAGDFRFHFSAKADPELVNRYGTSWTRADEIAAASHLFVGFTSEEGVYQAPSSHVTLAFPGMSIVDDDDHPDSSAWYKVAIVPAFVAEIQLADAEQTHYRIQAPQELRLVRGDAAVLASGQEARTDRWYVSSWADKAVTIGSPVILPAIDKTWGSLRAQYR